VENTEATPDPLERCHENMNDKAVIIKVIGLASMNDDDDEEEISK
jgi:hypothetical protein